MTLRSWWAQRWAVTAEILSDEGTLDAIRQGLDDIAGDVVTLDELRSDVPHRSAS